MIICKKILKSSVSGMYCLLHHGSVFAKLAKTLMVLLTTKRLWRMGWVCFVFWTTQWELTKGVHFALWIAEACTQIAIEMYISRIVFYWSCILWNAVSMRERISKKIFKKLVKESALWGNNIVFVNADHGDNRTLGSSRICTKT